MGTRIVAHGDDESGLDGVRRRFEEVEACCSRFDSGSELSRLNRAPGGRVAVGPLLAQVLASADRMRRLSGGLVDAGVGGAVAAWGYDRTFPEVRGLDEAPRDDHRPGSWRIDGPAVIRTAGVVLDLGGVAKGWACDEAVERGSASMVSAGGDLRSADAGAVVEVCGPAEEVVAVVPVGIGALATSSTSRRRWKAGPRTVGHLIDPRTGEPTRSPIVSATVTAGTAVEAEAGAKAVLLLGVEGLAWADRQPWIRGALAVWRDGSVYATTGLELAA